MYSTFNHLKWFTELHPMPEPLSFTAATGGQGYCYYIGTVEITIPNAHGGSLRAWIPNTHYYPESPANL
ncbi:hypothetical protein QBC36DRAFT_296209, partial [Triangularia setosa]